MQILIPVTAVDQSQTRNFWPKFAISCKFRLKNGVAQNESNQKNNDTFTLKIVNSYLFDFFSLFWVRKIFLTVSDLISFKREDTIGSSRVVQPKKFSDQSPKIRLSFRYWIWETVWFCPILGNRREWGLRRLKHKVSLSYDEKIFESKFKLLFIKRKQSYL